MTSFEQILNNRAREETNATFPVTMGVNAFRCILDEFNKKKERNELKSYKPKPVKKEKKKKEKEQYFVSIPLDIVG